MDDMVIEPITLTSTLKSARSVEGEVLNGPERRRRWSVEDKLRILAQAHVPGYSPSLVCRLHGLSTGLFCSWRKQFRSGALTGFAPVQIVSDPPELAASPEPPPAFVVNSPTRIASVIEVELPGGITVRVDATVNSDVLGRVLDILARR